MAGRTAHVHQRPQGADETRGRAAAQPVVFQALYAGDAGAARQRQAGTPPAVLLRQENPRDPGRDSGIGKSSLINKLVPGLSLGTGEVSDKLGRGRHTTRHVEFFPLDGETFVADTPGFASFEVQMVDNIEPEELQYHFRDFVSYLGSCRFDDCRHLSEPGCAVLAAVDSGELPRSRHESYKKLYEVLKAQSKTYR